MPQNFLTKGICSVIVLTIAIFLALFWINMLIDCTRRDYNKPYHRTLWILFIALLQIPAAFVYWLLVRRKD